MYKSIKIYNELDNSKVTRTELLELVELAKNENQIFILQKISNLLTENPNDKCFFITLKNKIPTYEIEDGILAAFEPVPEELQNEEYGLASPDLSYKEIAKVILEQMKEVTGNECVKKWKNKHTTNGFASPLNFVTKKVYSGVNFVLLKGENFFGMFENPYFLTAKQIEENGGTLKKNTRPKSIIYFNIIPTALNKKVTKEQLKTLKATKNPDEKIKAMNFLD